jgi:hypothetical protein
LEDTPWGFDDPYKTLFKSSLMMNFVSGKGCGGD